MSAQNTTIAWGTRYRITNGGVATLFNATSGESNSGVDPADVTDSESAGGRVRKAGVYEAEVTIRGNIAADVSPHSPPFAIAEGGFVTLIEIFFNGIGNPPDQYRNVFVDRFRKTAGPNMSEPNHYELHGYTAQYTPGQ